MGEGWSGAPAAGVCTAAASCSPQLEKGGEAERKPAEQFLSAFGGPNRRVNRGIKGNMVKSGRAANPGCVTQGGRRLAALTVPRMPFSSTGTAVKVPDS